MTGLGVLLLALFAVLMLRRAGPVLYTLREEGDSVGLPIWSVFNPLRDRGPEQTAETVLRALRDGKQVEILSESHIEAARGRQLALDAGEHRLLDWKLVHRRDDAAEVTLAFMTSRRSVGSLDSPLWLVLRRSADGGDWRVATIDGWY